MLAVTVESTGDDEAQSERTSTTPDVMQVTPDHPVYVEDEGWLLAENLELGDRLRRADGGMAKVLAIERLQLDEPQPVYNFTVKGPHTYFVLDAGVLVHNASCPPGSPENKAQRWQEYQQRTGGAGWDYERWSKTYEQNMMRARSAHDAVDAYHKTIGWGEREVIVELTEGGAIRRLDIADLETSRGIEYKTGYVTLDEKHRAQINLDSILIREDKWPIEWVIEGRASEPLLPALEKAGISFQVR